MTLNGVMVADARNLRVVELLVYFNHSDLYYIIH